jgi:hypothetical protein
MAGTVAVMGHMSLARIPTEGKQWHVEKLARSSPRHNTLLSLLLT